MTPRLILLFSLYLLFSSSVIAQFQLVGSAQATADPNCFVLTQAQNQQAGAVWYTQELDISRSFDIYAQLMLGGRDAGADGIAFVLQQVSTNEGSSGEGIGYGGIAPALSIEFDNHPNESNNDPQYDHLGIMANGVPDHSAPENLITPVRILPGVDNVEDGIRHPVRISWDAVSQTLEVYVECDLRASYTGDIITDIFLGDPNVFWGFTSATGNRNNQHEFCLDYVSFLEEMPDTAICVGESVQLNAGTGAGQTFSWFPATGLDNPNIPNPIASPTRTVTYVLTVTDDCGNTRTDDVTVNVGNLIAPDAGPDIDYCIGETTQIQARATGDVTYAWSPGIGLSDPTIAEPIVSATSTTTYTLTVSDSAGCTQSDQVIVTVNPLPIATAIAAENEICIGAQTSLTAAGGTTYNWFSGQGFGNPNSATISVSPTANALFEVAVEDANGCRDTASVAVTVNPLPVIEAGDDQRICEGSSVGLQATGASTYTWTPAAGLSDPTIANPVATPNGSSTFTVVGRDDNGCEGQDQVTVSETPAPSITGMPFESTCVGQPLTLSVSGADRYEWSNGATSPDNEIVVNIDSRFWVIPESNGCVGDTFFIDVTANQPPTISILPSSISGLAPFTVNFPNPGVASTYLWNFGDGNASNSPTPTHVYDLPGQYLVEVELASPFGCTTSGLVGIIDIASPEVYIPNAFSPNNDGFNDFFDLKLKRSEGFNLKIFNRWGRLVFQSQDPSIHWDGTIDGRPSPIGVYTYLLEVAASAAEPVRRYQGSLTLLR